MALRAKAIVQSLGTFSKVQVADGVQDDYFGGDLTPEAILVKNILEGMYSSLETLMKLKVREDSLKKEEAFEGIHCHFFLA